MKKKTSLAQPQKNLEHTLPVVNISLDKVRSIGVSKEKSSQSKEGPALSSAKEKKASRAFVYEAVTQRLSEGESLILEPIRPPRRWKDQKTGAQYHELRVHDHDLTNAIKIVRASLYYKNVYLPQKAAVRHALEQRDPALLPPFLGDGLLEFLREDSGLEALRYTV